MEPLIALPITLPQRGCRRGRGSAKLSRRRVAAAVQSSAAPTPLGAAGAHRSESAGLDPIPSAAGLHIAAVARKAVDDGALVAEALKLGVKVHALGAHYARRPVTRGLLFGYGMIEAQDVAEGLIRVRRALRAVDTSL